ISFKTSSLSSSEGLFFFTWSTTPSPPSHCRPHIEHPHLSTRTYILADLYTAGRVRRDSVARQIDPDIILPNEAMSWATARRADASPDAAAERAAATPRNVVLPAAKAAEMWPLEWGRRAAPQPREHEKHRRASASCSPGSL